MGPWVRCVTSQLLPGTPGTALLVSLSRPETNCSSWVRTWVRGGQGPLWNAGRGPGFHQALPGLPAPSSSPSIGGCLSLSPPYPVIGPDLVFCPRGHILGNRKAQLCCAVPAWTLALSPASSGGLTDLESIRTCRLYPVPISQTTPSGPVLPRCGGRVQTSPTPGDAPGRMGLESRLAGGGGDWGGVTSGGLSQGGREPLSQEHRPRPLLAHQRPPVPHPRTSAH